MISRFLSTYFVPLLILFVVLGFLVPESLLVPTPFMLPLLATMVFVSAFKIVPDRFLAAFQPRLAWYFLVRYGVLPVVLWWIGSRFDPILGVSLLLLTLAPAGSSSPGVTALYGGNVGLTIILVVVSSIAAPFIISLGLQLTIAQSIDIEIGTILRNLSITVAAPIALHLPLRRSKKIADWLRNNDSLVIVPIIGALVTTVIGREQAVLLNEIDTAIVFIAAAAGAYLVYFVTGWLTGRGLSIGDQASYALASGVNNTAMVIVVAYLYLPSQVSVFIVEAELIWVLGMILFKVFLRRKIERGSVTSQRVSGDTR